MQWKRSDRKPKNKNRNPEWKRGVMYYWSRYQKSVRRLLERQAQAQAQLNPIPVEVEAEK